MSFFVLFEVSAYLVECVAACTACLFLSNHYSDLVVKDFRQLKVREDVNGRKRKASDVRIRCSSP